MRARSGYVLVAVLWAGTALLMAAGAAGLGAWMQLSVARHAAEVQVARAAAEGALLWTSVALDEAVGTDGRPPEAPPPLPAPEVGEVHVTGYHPRPDGSVDVEVAVVRPSVRVRAGARWVPP